MAVGALARAGNDVIVDEAMFDPAGWAEWVTALEGLAVTWVRVGCDLSVCESRERPGWCSISWTADNVVP